MWKVSKSLAACVFAAVWWGIFYPELCFSEETCALVRTETAQDDGKEAQNRTEVVQDESRGAQKQTERVRNRVEGNRSGFEEIDAAAVWRASGDEIKIRSRLWEWCEENLFDAASEK